MNTILARVRCLRPLTVDKTIFRVRSFWDYSGIGILGMDGICVLLGAIPFSE